jgi:type III restriction enzyme
VSKAIIDYDRDLPEIRNRRPWEPPSGFLVKDPEAESGWRIDDSGRRPSSILLVQKIRVEVDAWRAGDSSKGVEPYAGVSDVTRRLFEYWFEEDHEVPGYQVPFRYHFCQREAIETLVYVVEALGNRDIKPLISSYANVFQKDLLSKSVEYQTTMDGRRQIRRYFPELEREGIQDLPPENLRRYAFKMATGSGKTWVMAMAVVWSHFHKKKVPGSDLSTNFLIVAPNVIVYQRLEKDFASNQIFYELPLIPPEWKGTWNQKVILRGESTEPDPSGNLFLTNVQQLYQTGGKEWTPQNAVEALLGRAPSKDLSSYERSMMERLGGLRDLVVLNDEAHHVHDDDLAWNKSLLTFHETLPKGLTLWLDFSATPKDQAGSYYPWILCDYPLAQAVEDRIVKAPIIATKEDDPNHPKKEPEHITKDNIADKYKFWIHAAMQRWRKHRDAYKKLGVKPVLFIMVEKNVYADGIGRYLRDTKELGLRDAEVLVIHTDEKGEITKKDLEVARQTARDIDKQDSKIKVIVSVMMLREGWDVRNVSVVLGLRPFTAKAEILPEQVIGRGLRLMLDVSPDRTQTLEVLGTKNLLDVVRDKLEADGVGVLTAKSDPPMAVIIEPVQERKAHDIAIPLTKPILVHNIRKLNEIDPDALHPIYDQVDLAEPLRITLKLEFATTETAIHQEDLAAGEVPIAQDVLSSITTKAMNFANISGAFAELYPIVRQYVSERCFGKEIDLDDESIRSHLRNPLLQEGIAKYLARKLSELTVEKRALEFDKAAFQLSDTRPFQWRRNLPPLVCDRTVFNYVATYNKFERRFAEFLDKAKDVRRFASLGTTEQGDSGTQFRVDYLKLSGAIGFYHPDWVVVQKTQDGDVNWIIETKGRVWEGTEAKDSAITHWCAQVSTQTGKRWRYARVNQTDFDKGKPTTLAEAVGDGVVQLL